MSNRKKDAKPVIERRIEKCSAKELKAENPILSAAELKIAGYRVTDLIEAGFKPNEIRYAGYSAKEVKDDSNTLSLRDLKEAGFFCHELIEAGYSIKELISAAFSVSELLGAKIAIEDVINAHSTVDVAKFKEAGCIASELKAYFSATELRNAGFSLMCLKLAGFDAQELKAAQATPADLKNIGFSALDLKNSGYSIMELKMSGFSAKDMKSTGCTLAELQEVGYNVVELKLAEYTDVILVPQSLSDDRISIGDLIEAGYTALEIRQAMTVTQVSATELKKSGCKAKDLKDARYTAMELKEAGFSLLSLKEAGFTVSNLKPAFSLIELKCAGFSMKELKQSGFSPKDFKNAGYSAKDMRLAGYAYSAIKDDFSVFECKIAGYDEPIYSFQSKKIPIEYELPKIISAGLIDEDLKNLGYECSSLKELGYTVSSLKSIGYTLTELKNADFSISELRSAGFSAQDLRTVNIDLKRLCEAGYTAHEIHSCKLRKGELRNTCGFSIADLKSFCSVSELFDEGFTISEFRSAEISVDDIVKWTKFTCLDMKNAGYSAGDFNCFNVSDLKLANFSVSDLKSAGRSVEEMKFANFSVSEMKAGGFEAKELWPIYAIESEYRSAGYTYDDLRSATGFKAINFIKAGYTLRELKSFDFPLNEMKTDGGICIFSATEFNEVGYSCLDMKVAECDFSGVFSLFVSDLKTLKSAGYSLKDFKAVLDLNIQKSESQQGFEMLDKEDGFSVEDELKKFRMRSENNPFSANIAKQGYAILYEEGGYSGEELKDAGFTVDAMRTYFRITDVELKKLGYTVDDMRSEGYSVDQLLSCGYTMEEIKASDSYSVYDLIVDAKFSVSELNGFGFSAAQFRNVTDSRILPVTPLELKNGGYDGLSIKEAGYTYDEMISSGAYTVADLKSFGYTVQDMKNADCFRVRDLRIAGYTALELKDAGILKSIIKSLGYSAYQMKEAGYSINELKEIGFTVSDLKELGYKPRDYKDAGYSATDMRKAGYSVGHLDLWKDLQLTLNPAILVVDNLVDVSYERFAVPPDFEVDVIKPILGQTSEDLVYDVKKTKFQGWFELSNASGLASTLHSVGKSSLHVCTSTNFFDVSSVRLQAKEKEFDLRRSVKYIEQRVKYEIDYSVFSDSISPIIFFDINSPGDEKWLDLERNGSILQDTSVFPILKFPLYLVTSSRSDAEIVLDKFKDILVLKTSDVASPINTTNKYADFRRCTGYDFIFSRLEIEEINSLFYCFYVVKLRRLNACYVVQANELFRRQNFVSNFLSQSISKFGLVRNTSDYHKWIRLAICNSLKQKLNMSESQASPWIDISDSIHELSKSRKYIPIGEFYLMLSAKTIIGVTKEVVDIILSTFHEEGLLIKVDLKQDISESHSGFLVLNQVWLEDMIRCVVRDFN